MVFSRWNGKTITHKKSNRDVQKDAAVVVLGCPITCGDQAS